MLSEGRYGEFIREVSLDMAGVIRIHGRRRPFGRDAAQLESGAQGFDSVLLQVHTRISNSSL